MDICSNRARGEYVYTPDKLERIKYPLNYTYIKIKHDTWKIIGKKKPDILEEMKIKGTLTEASPLPISLRIITPEKKDRNFDIQILYSDGQRVEVPKTIIKPKKVILAVDEAVLFFNKQKKITDDYLYLFSQHRKLGIDFYYTAQTLKGVNIILKANTMYVYDISHMSSIFFFSVYSETNLRKKGCVQWRGTFVANENDKNRYDTLERLAGAEWYITATEEIKKEASKILLSTETVVVKETKTK
jgi:hypothetical protein